MHSIGISPSLLRCLRLVTRISSRSLSSNLSYKMKELINSGRYAEALDLFDHSTQVPNEISLNLALKACTKLGYQQRGMQIHQTLSSTSLQNPFIQASLIHFYMQCKNVDRAEEILSLVDRHSPGISAAMMKGYISNGMPSKALELFQQTSVKANPITLLIVFNACAKAANAQAMKIGRNLLAQLEDQRLDDAKLINSAIDMLMKFGDVEHAERLFVTMKNKTIVSYGAMMQGYVINDLSEKALDLFDALPWESNRTIYAIVYSACASLCNDRAVRLAKKSLRQMPKIFLDQIVLVGSILQMLMKFGEVKEATRIFSQMNTCNMYIYGIMFNGYNFNDQPTRTLKLFEQLQEQEKIIIDEPIALALVSACSQIAILPACQRLVPFLPAHLTENYRVKTVLIDMWGKASAINEAKKIFYSITCPDALAYTAMINVYGRNGMGSEALDLYREMPENIRDSITYVCVLSACSHSGYVDQARSIFSQIEHKTEDVITTMIDCLCRVFLFDEAQLLIDHYEKSNPPNCIMYMTMLSAARNRRDAVRSQKLFDRMQSLFPDHKSWLTSASILVSNTCFSAGDDQEADKVRTDRMKRVGTEVRPGCTWTEVNGEIVTFYANDRSHPRFAEINAEMDRLAEELKENGHQFDSSWITRPLKEDETVESVLCAHSEKLAIAFNLIQHPKPSVIYVSKNLRVCGDCHRATKLIAKIRQCHIIVRDANRIHHFYPSGQCSCQDHF